MDPLLQLCQICLGNQIVRVGFVRSLMSTLGVSTYPRLLLTDMELFSLKHLWLDFITKRHCLEMCHFLHKVY